MLRGAVGRLLPAAQRRAVKRRQRQAKNMSEENENE